MARELSADDLPTLQAFFDANPEYFLTVGGAPPDPKEAWLEFDDRPPPDLGFSQRWFCGVFDAEGALVAHLNFLKDFVAPGVWHLALFILASARHGQGEGARIYQAFEQWCGQQGARWMRLGVVVGNAKGESFWTRQGFIEVRQRDGIAAGQRVNRVRVLVKPLTGGPLSHYLSQVARDRP